MEKAAKISLDGLWEFFYTPQKFEETTPLPARENFTGRMVTPGYWDDHYELFDEEDFFSLHARFNPDYRKIHFPMGTSILPHASSSFLIGSGFYRKQVAIDLPESGHVFLTVGPAMWGFFVFCNGEFVGKTTGYSVKSEYELTRFVRNHELNEIIIAVCNVHDDGGAWCRLDGTHDGTAFGARPGQHRGLAAQGYQSERAGIGDCTALRITGKSAILDGWITFESGKPHWHAELENAEHTTLVWCMEDENGVFDSGRLVCPGDEIDFVADRIPELWSDRSPKLYTARWTLLDGDAVLDERTQRWGARTLACPGTQIAINGEITYFRGVTEHCYFPETCNPHFDKAKYLHDLGVIRSAGFNFIRCHTWCPPEQFYEACDELGFLVQTELPSVWSFDEAEAIIRHIRRHASAVIFCEGNEKLIDDPALERQRKLVAMFRRMAPGLLYNPQEAMRFVEYDFGPGRKVEEKPIPHDAARLADVAEFSDVYGSLGCGYFSYNHDFFPSPEQCDYEHSHYKKPCLSHELGILGGYLDFDLEDRYKGTYIGTDLFEAARDYMTRCGVYQNRRRYFQNNCKFISSIRKQLIENIRSCKSITGYDYLGGIDTHWHFIGYPCGVFNEFYEEKFGESIADVRRYNNESVFLCSALRFRNRFAGSRFNEKILISYFGCKNGTVEGQWRFENSSGAVLASGTFAEADLNQGSIITLCEAAFDLPEPAGGEKYILRVEGKLNGESLENHWPFWVFPAEEAADSPACRTSDTLTADLIDYAARGGAVLLTGNFPAEMQQELFRPHTSGRTLGHSGALINPHPVWARFPHDGYLDWQFYHLMSFSHSLVYDKEMPEFAPAMELIPSFKLIRHKSMLSEFKVGAGRILMTGLVLDNDDPAGRFLKKELIRYLSEGDFSPAPEWSPDDLKRRLEAPPRTARREIAIDAGGRPVEK